MTTNTRTTTRTDDGGRRDGPQLRTFDVTIHAAVVRYIDLERDAGESFTAWIRGAIGRHLQRFDEDRLASQVAERIHTNTETTDAEIDERLTTADDQDRITITLAVPLAVLDALEDLEQPSADAAVQTAIWIRLDELAMHKNRAVGVPVEVPPEVALRAHYKATTHVAMGGDCSYEQALADNILNNFWTEESYLVDGQPVTEWVEEHV